MTTLLLVPSYVAEGKVGAADKYTTAVPKVILVPDTAVSYTHLRAHET